MNKDKKEYVLLTDMLSEWMSYVFRQAYPDSEYDFSSIAVVDTANPEFGDFQCNDCMSLSRTMRKAPRDIAQDVIKNADQPEFLDFMDVAGGGFINLRIKTDWLGRYIEQVFNGDDRLGVPMHGRNKTVVMDYGSPNVTKPLHIGHLRSHNIGSVLDRLFRFLGYKVIADNHLGDWGTQFGITIMGYRNFGDRNAMTESPLQELERVYVESYKKSQEDNNWLEQSRAELVKLQSGDPDNIALWHEFMDLSRKELDRVYKRLGVSFDLVRGESYYQDMLADTVKLLEGKGIAGESEGATVVFLEEEKLPVCIVRKSDGGYNYATTDIATIISRVKEFNPDRIIYITDERQQLHFQQIFTIARRLGCATQLDHVWFGLMRLPEATFSTREGNVIKLECLLDEAEKRALDIVRESSKGLDPEQQNEVARAVGIGAVKYADLSQNPQSLVTFTWDKALSLEGNSGPYLQYAYARIASVRDKYRERFPDVDLNVCELKLSEPVERSLALKLARFPEIVVRSAHAFKPSILTDYLYDLAQAYSNFYQNVPFLKAEEGVRESRVRLCGMIAAVLRKGLNLLGIETPERI